VTYRDAFDAAAARAATLEAELARVDDQLRAREDLTSQRERLRAELDVAADELRRQRRRRHLALVDRSARIGIATPCNADWDEMLGDDRTRRCGVCNRDVLDLSAYTLEEVDAFVLSVNEPPCIRLYRRADGTIVTRDCPSSIPKPWVEQALTVAALGGVTVLVAGAAAVALSPVRTMGRVTQSRSDALEVRSAVLLYMGQEAGAGCPTMGELTEAGVLDASRRTMDAWDNPFVVECEGDDITVISTGPDGRPGTDDDIRP
jgi:hypothetical protein